MAPSIIIEKHGNREYQINDDENDQSLNRIKTFMDNNLFKQFNINHHSSNISSTSLIIDYLIDLDFNNKFNNKQTKSSKHLSRVLTNLVKSNDLKDERLLIKLNLLDILHYFKFNHNLYLYHSKNTSTSIDLILNTFNDSSNLNSFNQFNQIKFRSIFNSIPRGLGPEAAWEFNDSLLKPIKINSYSKYLYSLGVSNFSGSNDNVNNQHQFDSLIDILPNFISLTNYILKDLSVNYKNNQQQIYFINNDINTNNGKTYTLPTKRWYKLLVDLLTFSLIQGYISFSWKGIKPIETLLSINKSSNFINNDDITDDQLTPSFLPSFQSSLKETLNISDKLKLEFDILLNERMNDFLSISDNCQSLHDHLKFLENKYNKQSFIKSFTIFLDDIHQYLGNATLLKNSPKMNVPQPKHKSHEPLPEPQLSHPANPLSISALLGPTDSEINDSINTSLIERYNNKSKWFSLSLSTFNDNDNDDYSRNNKRFKPSPPNEYSNESKPFVNTNNHNHNFDMRDLTWPGPYGI